MLEHLVGVDHVEGVVCERQGGAVGEHHLGSLDALGGELTAGQGGGLLGDLDCGEVLGADDAGEVRGDGAGPAAQVEQSVARPQMRHQVGGGVLSRTATMPGHHGSAVPVGVVVLAHAARLDS